MSEKVSGKLNEWQVFPEASRSKSGELLMECTEALSHSRLRRGVSERGSPLLALIPSMILFYLIPALGEDGKGLYK